MLLRISTPALLLFASLLGSVACTPRYSINPEKFAGKNVDEKGLVTVGSQDLLDVRVFGEPELSGPFRVTRRGMIRVPLIGLVHIAGLTPTEIEEKLRKELQRFLRDPQVTVVVKDYLSKKIFVFGEVNRPGTFAYESNMSIVQAITLAGGFTKSAWKNRTSVTRIIDGVEKKIEIPVEAIGEGSQKNFELRPGDIVFVPESPL
jgi:polysaccharide export outer membrane protein